MLNILDTPIATLTVRVVLTTKSVVVLTEVAVSSAEACKVYDIRPFIKGAVYFVALFDLSLGGDPAQLSGVTGGWFPEVFPLHFASPFNSLVARGL